jgi:hypothetical protein
MDNLSSHKDERVRQAIEQVGARLFHLPAYSPDLNPPLTEADKATNRHKPRVRAKVEPPFLTLKSQENDRSFSLSLSVNGDLFNAFMIGEHYR